MLSFDIVLGKNNKIFLKPLIDENNPEDYKWLDYLKTNILYRQEYNHFNKINPYMIANYVFNDKWIPFQFWHLIKEKLEILCGYEIVFNGIENYWNYMIDENFVETSGWKFPDNINTKDDKYKYQQEAVYSAIRHRIGSIEIGTSGGKTFITYMYCRWLIENYLINLFDETTKVNEMKNKILIVVPSITLVDQLIGDFITYDEKFERKLTVQGIYSNYGKIVLDYDIIVGTYQSLCKQDEEFFSQFKVFICDEAHKSKAYSIMNEIFGKIKNAEYFFGMTGTWPQYKKCDYLNVINMFGSPLVTKKAYELIESGVATPIKIIALNLLYPDNVKDFSVNLVESGIYGLEKYYKEKEFFQTYKPRTDLIKKILKNNIGISLILVNTIEYANILQKELNGYDDWVVDKITSRVKNRYDIIEKAKKSSGKYCIVATIQILSTGVSIPTMEYMYFVDGGKADATIRQSLGRLMRLFKTKKRGLIFDLYDNMVKSSFKKHGSERIKIYKENKFPYIIKQINLKEND